MTINIYIIIWNTFSGCGLVRQGNREVTFNIIRVKSLRGVRVPWDGNSVRERSKMKKLVNLLEILILLYLIGLFFIMVISYVLKIMGLLVISCVVFFFSLMVLNIYRSVSVLFEFIELEGYRKNKNAYVEKIKYIIKIKNEDKFWAFWLYTFLVFSWIIVNILFYRLLVIMVNVSKKCYNTEDTEMLLSIPVGFIILLIIMSLIILSLSLYNNKVNKGKYGKLAIITWVYLIILLIILIFCWITDVSNIPLFCLGIISNIISFFKCEIPLLFDIHNENWILYNFTNNLKDKYNNMCIKLKENWKYILDNLSKLNKNIEKNSFELNKNRGNKRFIPGRLNIPNKNFSGSLPGRIIETLGRIFVIIVNNMNKSLIQISHIPNNTGKVLKSVVGLEIVRSNTNEEDIPLNVNWWTLDGLDHKIRTRTPFFLEYKDEDWNHEPTIKKWEFSPNLKQEVDSNINKYLDKWVRYDKNMDVSFILHNIDIFIKYTDKICLGTRFFNINPRLHVLSACELTEVSNKAIKVVMEHIKLLSHNYPRNYKFDKSFSLFEYNEDTRMFEKIEGNFLDKLVSGSIIDEMLLVQDKLQSMSLTLSDQNKAAHKEIPDGYRDCENRILNQFMVNIYRKKIFLYINGYHKGTLSLQQFDNEINGLKRKLRVEISRRLVSTINSSTLTLDPVTREKMITEADRAINALIDKIEEIAALVRSTVYTQNEGVHRIYATPVRNRILGDNNLWAFRYQVANNNNNNN